MSNENKKNESKAIEMLQSDPCVSLNEVYRKTGVATKRLSELVSENNIQRMTRKEYVKTFLEEHPYYTYAVVEEHVHYGQGNIARLAKKEGLGRDPHEMTKMLRDEFEEMYRENPNFDINVIVEKFGISTKEVDRLKEDCAEKIVRENKISHKEKILDLLQNTQLDYTNISNIIGCDLGYVSRLAKMYDLQRTCSFAEALSNNIKYYLENEPELSYEEIRHKLNRCPIDKVEKIAREMNVSRRFVPEEDKIVAKLISGSEISDVASDYEYGVKVIEKIAIKFNLLERDPEMDAKVLEILRERSTCTYTEISNILGYNYSLVKQVAEENGYIRTSIDYGGKNKQEIIDLLEKNPKMTYKEIGKKVNRSQHTVWRIAKENNLGHNKKSKEA